MRIGVVDQHYFPSDRLERFRKIVATLAQAGNSVVVMCRSDGEKPAVEKLDPYMLVYRFGKSSVNNLGRILSYPAPFNILWTGWIRKVICEEKLDALVVQNLRLAIPTLLAARLAGIPVLFDNMEYFPTMSRTQLGRANQIKYLLKHPAIISLIEYLTVRLVDHTCVVVEEQKQRLIKMGVPEENISVVSNTPLVSSEDVTQLQAYPAFDQVDEFRLIYAGIITKGRGLDLILQALQHIKACEDKKPLVKFFVIGDGIYFPRLQELARELMVEDRVDFLGWRSPQEIPALLRQSHVGVIPHVVSDFWNHTIPSKLFEYMLCGLPVLCTQADPVQRIVETEKCGVAIPEHPMEVAETILELKDNLESLRAMGHRGRQAVLNKYNWEQDSAVFLQAVYSTFC